MGKEIVSQVQEAQSVADRINKPKEEHTVIKLIKTKDKDKILKQQGKNDK